MSSITSTSPPSSPSNASARFFSPNRNEIVSTNPSGCAAADHSRNSGFLASSMNFVPVSATMYGPVAGTGSMP